MMPPVCFPNRSFAHRFAFTAWVLSPTVVLWLAAGCGLNTHGLGTSSSDGLGGALACNVDTECNDQNRCTADTCVSSKFCVFQPLSDGPAPDSAQTIGDCESLRCKGGKELLANDNADVPDDHRDCTQDSCAAGVASHVPKPSGMPCNDGSGNTGSCDPEGYPAGQGDCVVACTTTKDCNNKNPCVTILCDTTHGRCVQTPLPDLTPTPSVTPVTGDCHVRVCFHGTDVDQVDDSDLPKTDTDCDTEVCTNGVATHGLLPLDTPCATYDTHQKGFCDGNGTCRQCAMPDGTECVDPQHPNDDCQHQACDNFTCTTVYAPKTQTTNDPIAGDCHTRHCDGTGGTTSDVDDNDKANSGTPCILDGCANGTPTVTFNPGAACGTPSNPRVCNAQGHCGCQNDTDCTVPMTCGGGGTPLACGCTPKTCGQLGKTCGSSTPDGCFSTLNCNGAQDGTESDVDCGGSSIACATRCTQGKACKLPTDCANGLCVDGVCCNTACAGACWACTTAKTGQPDGQCSGVIAGTDPDNECMDQGMASCGTTGVCDGSGACALAPGGTSCQAASCSGNTRVSAKTCDGAGHCNLGGATSTCPNGLVCDPTALPAACYASCGSNDPLGDGACVSGHFCDGAVCQPKQGTGAACSRPAMCTSNTCTGGTCD